MSEDRKGYVYVLKAQRPHDDCSKIGRTNNPKKRLHDFGVKLPYKVTPVLIVRSDDCHESERLLHEAYKEKRIDGEWFKLSDADIESIRYAALWHEAEELFDRILEATPQHEEPLTAAKLERRRKCARLLHKAAERAERRQRHFNTIQQS